MPSIWVHIRMLTSGQSGIHAKTHHYAALKAEGLQTHQSDILCPQNNGETGGQMHKIRTTSSSPLHDRQHAYQTGRTVDTALVEAVTFVKKGMKNKGLVLASLLDEDGAFNHTTKESIVKGAEDHLVPSTISR